MRQPRFALAVANVPGMSWWTIDAGGAISTSSSYSLQGSVGQPDAGSANSALSSASFQVVGGFWHASSEEVTGDYTIFLPSIQH